MKQFAKSALPLILLVPCVLLPIGCGGDDDGVVLPDAGPTPTEKRLVILHTNDEHSHLFGFAPEVDDYPNPTTPGDGTIVGGIARRARVLKELRAAATAEGIDTLTVSAGDETQGALPQVAFQTSSPDFRLMKQLGYDVMCPGNHEFDLGPGAYAAAISAAGGELPQIVSTNIHFDATSALDDSLAALYGEGTSTKPIKRYHVITTPSGIKVGFFGVMGVQASFFSQLKGPLRFSVEGVEDGITGLDKVYADIEGTVATLRDVEKVDVVIMVSHGGVDTAHPEAGEDFQIAAHVGGIDAIISGHSHTALAAPQVAMGPDGHEVPIVQAGSYGDHVGRLELIVKSGARPGFDKDAAKTHLVTIDDKIVPDDTALLAKLDAVIEDLEAHTLADVWARILGVTVTDDADVVGDLYFRSVGTTDFDVIGQRAYQETNILDLSTDSMLAAAAEAGKPAQISVDAAGSVRGDIVKGKTGKMTLADLFRIFPLGFNPIDGSVGFPLCRFFIYKVEIKGALEIAASRGLMSDPLFLSPGGIKAEFDTSRAEAVLSPPTALLNPQNGRVTKITFDEDGDGVPEKVIFDLARPPGSEWDAGDNGPTQLYAVVTSLYVAEYADSAGVTLKDADENPISLVDSILTRADGSDVKQYEAFIKYIADESAKNGGKLPGRYDESTAEGAVPRRMICSGPLCP
jgi:2',3'-cyclic-nucleotide 2'-phosphodiesterase (5'-nucleotidase family)